MRIESSVGRKIVSVNSKKRSDSKVVASEHIKKAIDVLGSSAKAGDKEAREIIANLGVILLDINSRTK